MDSDIFFRVLLDLLNLQVNGHIQDSSPEWATKKVSDLTASREHSWKANLLLPIEKLQQLQASFDVVRNISYPTGFLKIVGLTGKNNETVFAEELSEFADDFSDQDVFASWTVITAATFGKNLQPGIETFAGAFYKPNTIFLTMPEDESRYSEFKAILDTCRDKKIGVLLHEHSDTGKGERTAVNVWFADRGPAWEFDMDLGNQDLALLTGYKLKRNWSVELRLVTVVMDVEQKEAANNYLRLVAQTARIPNAATTVVTGNPGDKTPLADLRIFPRPDEVDFAELRQYTDHYRANCLLRLIRVKKAGCYENSENRLKSWQII